MSLILGTTFFTFISDSGDVYSWGRNDYSQLGRPSSTPATFDPIPKVIPELKGVKQVVCASEHNLALTGMSVLLPQVHHLNDYYLC